MDEGILVAYPSLVQQGEVPGRDFETFYGPGEAYVVAGAFEVLGDHVWVERAVGLLVRLAIVAAIFALVAWWGWIPALLGALASVAVMLPLGISALSWFCGLAFALAGLALLFRSSARQGGRLAFAAGLVSALALIFRPDLAPAVVLPTLAMLVGSGAWRRWGAGLLVGLIPTLVWLAVVGPADLHHLISDLAASRSGRRLPLPSLTSSNGQVLAAALAVTLALLGIGGLRLARRRLDAGGRMCLALGLFCLAILPAAVQRADDAHVLASGCVAIGFAPVAFCELARVEWAHRLLARAAAAAVALLALVAIAHAAGPTVRTQALGFGDPGAASDVENAGRSFPIDSPRTARGLNTLLAKLDSASESGERVFVGPVDLRLTNYGDSFLYYLLPGLTPASFYTELNSRAANASDSGLAEDLSTADFLLLTTRYDDWDEPNTSTEPGSAEPLTVVRKDFCELARAGSYRLLERCDRLSA